MRKADYQTLARIIATQRKAASSNARDFVERVALDKQTEAIAREFAASASVDKAAFLKACKLD